MGLELDYIDGQTPLDIRYWHENNTYPPDEIAVGFQLRYSQPDQRWLFGLNRLLIKPQFGIFALN